MTRTLARNRAGWASAVTVVCRCGKRLAVLDEQFPGWVDGAMTDHVEWTKTRSDSGKVVYWWRVRCRRCGRDRRGPESQLLAFVRECKAEGLTKATFPE